MKNRIVIDFNVSEGLNGDNICALSDDIKDFIENHELTCETVSNITVKYLDEYCIKRGATNDDNNRQSY